MSEGLSAFSLEDFGNPLVAVKAISSEKSLKQIWASRQLPYPETNMTSHLKIGQAPKGKDRIPTIHFQVLLLMANILQPVDM